MSEGQPKVGDRVRVAGGPWAGYYGHIVGIRGGLWDIRFEAPRPANVDVGAYDARNFTRDSNSE